jgi:hypothetical protein
LPGFEESLYSLYRTVKANATRAYFQLRARKAVSLLTLGFTGQFFPFSSGNPLRERGPHFSPVSPGSIDCWVTSSGVLLILSFCPPVSFI